MGQGFIGACQKPGVSYVVDRLVEASRNHIGYEVEAVQRTTNKPLDAGWWGDTGKEHNRTLRCTGRYIRAA